MDFTWIEKIVQRRSCRQFAPVPLSGADLQWLVRVVNNSPTSSNQQAFSVIIIDDDNLKAKICAFGLQEFLKTAPIYLLFCIDLNRIEFVFHLHSNQNLVLDEPKMRESFLLDLGIAVGGLNNALVGLGLQTCIMGSVQKYAKPIAQLLGMTDCEVVLGLAVGYEECESEFKPKINKCYWNQQYSLTAIATEGRCYLNQTRDYYAKVYGPDNPKKTTWADGIIKLFSKQT